MQTHLVIAVAASIEKNLLLTIVLRVQDVVTATTTKKRKIGKGRRTRD